MSQFTDSGLIIRVKPHGEGALILTVLTAQHGVRSGYVHAGRISSRLRGVLQIGNQLHLDWQGQTENDLGRFSVEAEDQATARILTDKKRLLAVQSVCALLEQCVGEREVLPGLYEGSLAWFESLSGDAWAPALVMWELHLLNTLGFGLNLDACVATGVTQGLTHVSPKSGGAVCAQEAQPYADKLLPLPSFLRGEGDYNDGEVAIGLRLTGYFLFHRVLDPLSRTIPDVRERLYQAFLPLHESSDMDIS